MQIGPQYAASHVLRRVQKMMVVVPVNAHVDKTHDVAEKNRQDRSQVTQSGSMRWFYLQHHNSDDDRNHAVTESFHSAFVHHHLPGVGRPRFDESNYFVGIARLYGNLISVQSFRRKSFHRKRSAASRSQ